MRAGACTVQQTLTSEAASVLKHSLGLARRRGHAQVTPLHVAATLLSSRVSLLRRACLKSHPHSTSHPLQCRALELCFNVALNRLPTTPGPLLHTTHPSLSNALIAALKRAQAHQRRGCIEQQQQQPLLAIKVELEQLIISILDDPSVSRVMREAGFSSTCVKNNIEDSSFASSSPSSSSLFYTTTSNGGVQLSSSSCLETTHRSEIPSSFWQNPLFFPAQKINTHFVDSSGESAKEDLKLVLEVLLRKNKKRNTVIVGDCLSTAGNLVSQLMEKVERGDVPEELKSAHFVKFGVSSLSMRFMKRDDVEMKVADLRRRVGTVVSLGGAIIYAGDLKWVVEEDVRCHESYNPADHMIVEIGRLISDFSSMINSKVWLIGIANYQTYMRCQMKTPSLELQWALQPVAVPSGGLGLSLHASSAVDSRTTLSHNNISQLLETKPFAGTPKEEQDILVCCGECTSNYEKEASGILKSSSSSSLITKDEKETQIKGSNTTLPYWMQQFTPADNHHTNDVLLDLRRKWNRLCQSLHHHARQNGSSTYARSQPWWTSSTLQFNANINSPSHFQSASKPSSNYNRLSQFTSTNQGPSSDSLEITEHKDVKITLALGNSHFSESENEMRGKMGREELSQALLANLPCHSDSIPSMVRALFDDQKLNSKRGTWLLIRGCDWVAKRRLALTMADSVLGSVDRLVEIDSKRSSGQSCERTLVEALRKDSNRVILIEDLDYAEPDFVKVLARGYEEGKLMEDPSGREVSLRKAIIILSVGIISSTTKTGEGENRGASVIQMKLVSDETRNCCKRKADWDWDSARNKSKCPKTGDEGDLSVSRQSSFSTLDLNVSAEGDDSDSDLTQEAPAATHHELVESIKNSFVMDRNPSRSDRIGAVFRSKIEAAAAEAWGDEFEMEAEVVGELVKASAYFLDSFFEKWLKDVFQTSCLTVKNGGKGGIVLRLCLGGKEENVSGFGFLGSTSLPGRIQVVM